MKKLILIVCILICLQTNTHAQRLQWNYYQQSPSGTPCQANYNNPIVYRNVHICDQYCGHTTTTVIYIVQETQCAPRTHVSEPSVTIVISPKRYYKKQRPASHGIVKRHVYKDSDEYTYEEEVYREITQ